MTRKCLLKLLEKHHVYRGEEYVDDLLARIKRREIQLMEMEEVDGELAILMRVAVVQVSYKWPGSNLVSRLIELTRKTKKKEQVCQQRDGIGHKILSNESPIEGAKRVFSKKLRKKGLVPVPTGRIDTEVRVDPRFAFLPTVKIRYYFEAEMPSEKFKSNGYDTERISPSGIVKRSIFGWIPAPLWS